MWSSQLPTLGLLAAVATQIWSARRSVITFLQDVSALILSSHQGAEKRVEGHTRARAPSGPTLLLQKIRRSSIDKTPQIQTSSSGSKLTPADSSARRFLHTYSYLQLPTDSYRLGTT
ncbi:hypothetical protein B0H16DRAFT_557937 [Mycena metata]|uniref:Secreted protein n=1 Tax=Mycena metata TaxID=1033252 RepID=A0AAD7JB24_9AGAR|nr:hypothetical protein B0H16DRAFT_557937 [Mycena metata]